jgi:hypothetical protein
MRLNRLKAGDFFEFQNTVYYLFETCSRRIGAVHAIRFGIPGMRCLWGEFEVRHIEKVKITEG